MDKKNNDDKNNHNTNPKLNSPTSEPKQNIESFLKHYWDVLGESANNATSKALVLAKNSMSSFDKSSDQASNSSDGTQEITLEGIRMLLSQRDTEAIYRMFQNPTVLARSFPDPTHKGGVDADALLRCFYTIKDSKSSNLADALFGRAMCKTLPKPSVHSSHVDESVGWGLSVPSARHLLMLMLFPGLFDVELHSSLCAGVIYATSILPEPSRKDLISMLAALQRHHLSQVTAMLHHWLTVRFCDNPKADAMLFAACHAIGLVFQANQQSHVLELPAFYNDALNNEQHVVLKDHYLRWKQTQFSRPSETASQFSVCRFPYLLDAHSKSRILQFESEIEMNIRFGEAMFQSLFVGPMFGSPFFQLHIRRDHVINDCISQLQNINDVELKKPLKVSFDNEAGVDEGGVRKEFFQIVIRDLFDVVFGMFTFEEETGNFWFNHDSFDDREFELVGVVLGLAIYNSIILDLHFPDVVYKKLLKRPVTLHDLKGLSPSRYNSLIQLLEYTGNVETDMGLTFEVPYTSFGEPKVHELIPNGSTTPVTNHNRKEFVKLHVQYVLQTSMMTQWESFSRGFHKVCNSHALALFEPEELELLVCGSRELDFYDLERVCRYDGGFTASTPIVRDFWAIVHSLPIEKKKKFLFFCTGSDRAPVKGLGHLPQGFTLARNGPDSDRLPTAHTCFNHLLLPEYSNRVKLEHLLVIAIENAEGFGLR